MKKIKIIRKAEEIGTKDNDKKYQRERERES